MILFKLDWIFYAVPEGGVATSVLVFVVKHEKSLRAHNAAVHANVLLFPEFTRKRPFITLALSYVVLQRGQFLSEILSHFPFLTA